MHLNTQRIRSNFIFLSKKKKKKKNSSGSVNDNGSGVNPNEFEKIFTPFYRVDEARTRATGGTGLGLAIVSHVIKEHQGSVWAEKSPLGGLSMNIKLPLWISK
ncbi:TPA: ATP-binding protein [Haemophilus influenzae]